MKISLFFILSLIIVIFFATDVLAQNDYVLLAPLPGLESTADLDAGGGSPTANYFSTIYQIGVSIVLVIAVVMLVYGGIEYMTSDSIVGKGNGREIVSKAIIGIVLAVTSYALLYVIGGTDSVSVGFDELQVEYIAPPDSEDSSFPGGGEGGGGGGSSGGRTTDDGSILIP
jgi:hypothetical protein